MSTLNSMIFQTFKSMSPIFSDRISEKNALRLLFRAEMLTLALDFML